MEERKAAEYKAIRRWYNRLESRDAELRARLDSTLDRPEASFAPQDKAAVRATPMDDLKLETIVQTGRPALFVVKDKILPDTPLTDPVTALMVNRLMAASDKINPWMPLIGRIDVDNHPAGHPYVGTGWLIQPGIICTNRHVAELIGRRDGTTFSFTRGRFNRPLVVSLNRRHEHEQAQEAGDAFPITGIAWIEPSEGPDVALLKVDMTLSSEHPQYLPLAEDDGRPDDFVACVGYPARAYEDTIPDQRWMDEIYGGIYDVKRAAPGQLDQPADGSTTYDPTTLGGMSGSPVFDLKSGKVVALHYAGLYKIENYGVPASVLRRYTGSLTTLVLRERPPVDAVPAPVVAVAAGPDAGLGVAGSSVSLTLPLTITVSLGPLAGMAADVPLDDAVMSLAREGRPGVLAVKSGFNGRTDCIVIAADPEHYEAVRAAAPASYRNHPVDVRYATLDEQLGLSLRMVEAPGSIVYDDRLRKGAEFSFDDITDEDMTVIAHVGPEQSFPVLERFLRETEHSLVSSMYQFFADHIAQAVEARLKTGQVKMRLVVDPATRDPSPEPPKPGEFDRSETFASWAERYGLDNIYVRKGNGGLVESAYHIKVTVRDEEWVWLSSGNWTRSSQPIPDASSQATKGNREWHIVARSKRLAAMFAAHIAADFEQCRALGGTAEAPAAAELMVDVPDDIVTEAPVQRLSPLEISGRIRVKPILTPDRRGRVYTDAVLGLIHSATDQLVVQNQYMRIRKGMSGNLSDLVDALIEASKRLRDVRVILRSGDVDDDITELRRRGLDVMRCVKLVSNTHTKGVIADGRRVLVGSQNWSQPAVTSNRDASLLFDDTQIADYFLQAFEIDWLRGGPPAGPRSERPVLPARGSQPPAGYSRMTLTEYRTR